MVHQSGDQEPARGVHHEPVIGGAEGQSGHLTCPLQQVRLCIWHLLYPYLISSYLPGIQIHIAKSTGMQNTSAKINNCQCMSPFTYFYANFVLLH